MKIRKITASDLPPQQPIDPAKLEAAYLQGWDAKAEKFKGEWMIIPPEYRDSPNGRAFLHGWNDYSPHKTREIPPNLIERVQSDEHIPIT